jgi:hypothetical protein
MTEWKDLYFQHASGVVPPTLTRELTNDLLGREQHDRVFDDAYHAALMMKVKYRRGYDDKWRADANPPRFFRGQRCEQWPLVPSLFRTRNGDLTEALITQRLRRLGPVIRQLQLRTTPLENQEAVAIAQHYAKELEVMTWMIDFTRDPLVALFFASDGGSPGEVGIVWSVNQREWNEHSVSGTNQLGTMEVIEPKGIRRIAAQRACFLSASHPELFAQHVPFRIRFHQRAGLVFEDPNTSPPITQRDLYVDDPELAIARIAQHAFKDLALPALLPPGVTRPLQPTVKDYFAIAESWCRAHHWQFDAEQLRCLVQVCEFYAKLQEHAAELPSELRSLRRLEEMTQAIQMSSDEPSRSRVLDHVFNRVSRYSDEFQVLETIRVACGIQERQRPTREEFEKRIKQLRRRR